ncbi:hypothetical protein M0R01_01485 [bacterium]|nr:hypothetical protein [bacterium]
MSGKMTTINIGKTLKSDLVREIVIISQLEEMGIQLSEITTLDPTPELTIEEVAFAPDSVRVQAENADRTKEEWKQIKANGGLDALFSIPGIGENLQAIVSKFDA